MSNKDKKTIVMNFREELETFTVHVNQLHTNAALSTKPEFLEKVAQDVNRLYASSIQVQKGTDQEIEEIGLIIQNIFVQPLAIKHRDHVSILKAVETFGEQKKEECDLSFIMKEYVNHPASTKSFIRELEILTDDLNDALKKIA
ncbi:MAG: hypothetical protein KDK76_02450 [Chlamydiia bacterium]|nr:hypothetical protein [Chlamydiia bacterium]